MAKSYNWQNIRKLLTEAFTDEELRRFCFDSSEFRPVYEQLSQQTGKTQIIQLLLDYANRKNLAEPLLLWAKEQNPAYYEQCQPYFEYIPYWRVLIEGWQHRVRRWGGQSPTIFNTLLIVLPLIILILLPILVIYLRDYRRPGDWLSPIISAPGMEEGHFNVAVAEFTPLNIAESPQLREDIQLLSNSIFSSIKTEIERTGELDANFWGPDIVGTIPGADAKIRATNAKAFADPDQYNVNLLIYGVITSSHNSFYLQPEVYVSWRGIDYASEVIGGANQLGPAIPFNLRHETVGTQQELNNELVDRRKVLQHLVIGLGRFYDSKYNEAWAEFFHASLVEQNKGGEEEQGKGQEVVYLLMGAAKLLISESLSAKPKERAEALTDAANAFSEAYKRNKSYDRSYLGLGAVALQQALIYNSTGTDIVRVLPDRLAEAEYWYSNTLNTSAQPTSWHIPVKVDYSLGQIHLVGYEFNVPGWSGDEARRHLERVIVAYDPNQKPELNWFVGDAYALLCRLSGLDRQWAAMSTECQKAIKILVRIEPGSDRIWQAVARSWLLVACAEKKQGNIDEARVAYDKAVQTGQGYISAEELAKWQAAREKVEEGDSCREP